MSRHILKPRPEAAHVRRAVVGWDRPLQTYYAQVFTSGDDEDEDGEIFIWVGTEPGELHTPEAAIAIVAAYAIVDPTLASILQEEMEATIGQRDTAYQAEMKRQLFGPLH